MTGEGFVYIDGVFFSSSEPIFYVNNRSFRYGDGVFESVRIINKSPCFLDAHILRLKRGMSILGFEYEKNLSKEFFLAEIESLLQKNNIEKDARLRISFFRKEGGYYTPQTNEACMLIEVEAIQEEGYSLNIKGLTIDIFPDYKKQRNAISGIKTANALLNVLAGLYKNKNKLDDCVILNDVGNIIEATNSNIFAVKNGVLYTPPIEEGCVNGIMREQVIKIATQNRISVYEIELKMNVLLNSDEVFFTNAIQGIQWVGAYKAKRYYNNTAKFFVEKLNSEQLV